jgi:hypothetical protein
MYLAIDNRRLIRQPHTIEIVPDKGQRSMNGDGRPMWRPGGDYTVFNCKWGADASYQDVLRELDRLGMTRGVHAITLELYKGQFLTVNAYMDKPAYTMIGQSTCGKVITNAFTIPFIQVDTPTFLYRMDFNLPGILAVDDARASHVAPAAGRIFDIGGWIRDLGSGAGRTKLQVSNGATDYLSTRGTFPNTLPVDKKLQNAVLGASLDFAAGDQIDIDVDEIPAGGLSKDARIWLWCWLFQP